MAEARVRWNPVATACLAGFLLLWLPPVSMAACPDGPCITYTLEADETAGRLQRSVYRIEAVAGATPENVSAALNVLDPRPGSADLQLTSSPNGQWLALITDHFDDGCAGLGGCLAIVSGDLSAGQAIRAGDGLLIAPDGIPAVANTGRLLVYADNERTAAGHGLDLFAIRRTSISAPWGIPKRLTTASPFANNRQPALANDGSKVLSIAAMATTKMASASARSPPTATAFAW